MPTPVASARQRLTFILAVVSCIVLLPLTQASLGYLSARVPSPWYWLIGTPIYYLLISALAAFWASGSFIARRARRRGSLIGTIGGLGGAALAALITALFSVWSLHTAQVHPTPGSRLPGGPGLALFGLFFILLPLFLVLNLLGIALAPLGGMLGGHLRAHLFPSSRSEQEWPAEQERARPWRVVLVVVLIAGLLAILMGVAFIVLAFGAFP